jgi:aldehyde dehydrogenase (NAD+)
MKGTYGAVAISAMHAKSILFSPPDGVIDHLFPPYSVEKVRALKQWFDY